VSAEIVVAPYPGVEALRVGGGPALGPRLRTSRRRLLGRRVHVAARGHLLRVVVGQVVARALQVAVAPLLVRALDAGRALLRLLGGLALLRRLHRSQKITRIVRHLMH
jgi:hypothetical protein